MNPSFCAHSAYSTLCHEIWNSFFSKDFLFYFVSLVVVIDDQVKLLVKHASLLRISIYFADSRPPTLQILHRRRYKKVYGKMYDRMQISLCISVMWIRCPVSSHRCTRLRFFCLYRCRKERQGMSTRPKRYMSVYFIFSNIYHAEKDTSDWTCIERRKENHFPSRAKTGLWMCRSFFCNFYHRLTCVLCWRCYESIIWLSFILLAIDGFGLHSEITSGFFCSLHVMLLQSGYIDEYILINFEVMSEILRLCLQSIILGLFLKLINFDVMSEFWRFKAFVIFSTGTRTKLKRNF